MVQFVALAVCMQKFTHQHFGFGVFAFYAAHVVAAGCSLCTWAMFIKVHVTGQTYPQDAVHKVLPGCVTWAENLTGFSSRMKIIKKVWGYPYL
jgi:hypothetical protein